MGRMIRVFVWLVGIVWQCIRTRRDSLLCARMLGCPTVSAFLPGPWHSLSGCLCKPHTSGRGFTRMLWRNPRLSASMKASG